MEDQEDDHSSVGHEDNFSEDSFSDEAADTGNASAPMMSIFASYYGIVDPNQTEAEAKGTIDDSNFDADEYVKVRSGRDTLSVIGKLEAIAPALCGLPFVLCVELYFHFHFHFHYHFHFYY